MKTALFCFSATGNSLWTARKIAGQLEDCTIEMLPLPEKKAIPKNAERYGLVFPIIMFGIPLLVEQFIKTLVVPKGAYVFAVATCGGTPFGALTQVKKHLNHQGIVLNAGFSVPIVNNCTSMGPAVSPEKQRIRIQRAAGRIDAISSQIRAGINTMHNGFPLLNWYFTGIIHEKARNLINGASKYFYVDEKCNGCGICKKVCRVNNVEIDTGKPKWSERCEQCYACLQWCPKESIQVRNKQTSGRRRYHHPEIVLNDIC